MVADVVATPVLERLAAGERRGVVRGATPRAAYADLDGFVVALTAPGVPLMPNGVAVRRTAVADAPVTARPGRIAVGADTVTWDAARPPAWEPALRRPAPAERGALADRGAAILAALGTDEPGVTHAGRGREGADHLRRALADRDATQAARAAERLMGLGGGLTPEGDDLLAATAAVVAAVGDAVGFAAAERQQWLAALVPADRRERTTALSATLLELAAEGRISEPVHPLLEPGEERWRTALERLRAVGASTGRAYAVAVGAALRALAA